MRTARPRRQSSRKTGCGRGLAEAGVRTVRPRRQSSRNARTRARYTGLRVRVHSSSCVDHTKLSQNATCVRNLPRRAATDRMQSPGDAGAASLKPSCLALSPHHVTAPACMTDEPNQLPDWLHQVVVREAQIWREDAGCLPEQTCPGIALGRGHPATCKGRGRALLALQRLRGCQEVVQTCLALRLGRSC